MFWTDSQDYGADEILYTTGIVIFNKISRLILEIIILFEVYPQLFLYAHYCWHDRILLGNEMLYSM